MFDWVIWMLLIVKVAIFVQLVNVFINLNWLGFAALAVNNCINIWAIFNNHWIQTVLKLNRLLGFVLLAGQLFVLILVEELWLGYCWCVPSCSRLCWCLSRCSWWSLLQSSLHRLGRWLRPLLLLKGRPFALSVLYFNRFGDSVSELIWEAKAISSILAGIFETQALFCWIC